MIKGKSIFIDSDVLIDVIMERLPHYHYSAHIIALGESGYFRAYTSALVLANCHYITKRHNHSREAADRAIMKLRSFIDVLPTTGKAIGESLNSDFKDFEDGVQFFTALSHEMDFLVTRNITDYPGGGPLKVYTPREFIAGP